MSHVTLHDLLNHELTGTPLPCTCDDCMASLNLLRRERQEPRRQSEAMGSGFWTRQEESLDRRLRRRRSWTPLLAAAALLFALALGFLLTPQQSESPSSIARLSEQEQEELLLEVDAILERSPIGEYDILLEDAEKPEQTSTLRTGGPHEA